ncbi:MAG: cysteine hydrolase [Clostridia bacterium]|nr:cysteine hydrolase [Clostridia bacterium]
MKKILIVVDMQNDFVDGALGSKEAAAIVENVVKKIESFDGEIYVTYDTHYEDYMQTSEGKNLPVAHCIRESEGWQLNTAVKEALDKKESYTEIEKITFGSVDLPFVLAEENDMDNAQIELIGLCTDICVVSNALILKASFPEIDISVDSSCCAGVTPEKHLAALETMRSCQIIVK